MSWFGFQSIKKTTIKVQPRESKLRTEDNAQAHKSSSEFEIAALFLDRKIERSERSEMAKS